MPSLEELLSEENLQELKKAKVSKKQVLDAYLDKIGAHTPPEETTDVRDDSEEVR